jgi:catechol 2,3-dioxygenase-like lactoylglutathione lyase family enzyme
MAAKVRFVYSGIRVQNLARSLGFYRRFGFREVARGRMDHGGRWIHLRFPGSEHRLELNYYPASNRYYEPVRRGTEFDHFGFFTDDLPAWRRRGARAGARLVADFPERGTYRQVYFEDPDGNWLGAFGPNDRPIEAAVRSSRRRGRP